MFGLRKILLTNVGVQDVTSTEEEEGALDRFMQECIGGENHRYHSIHPSLLLVRKTWQISGANQCPRASEHKAEDGGVEVVFLASRSF